MRIRAIVMINLGQEIALTASAIVAKVSDHTDDNQSAHAAGVGPHADGHQEAAQAGKVPLRRHGTDEANATAEGNHCQRHPIGESVEVPYRTVAFDSAATVVFNGANLHVEGN